MIDANKINKVTLKEAEKNKRREEKAEIKRKKQWWKELKYLIKQKAKKGSPYICLTPSKYGIISRDEFWDTLHKKGYWITTTYGPNRHECTRDHFNDMYCKVYIYICWGEQYPDKEEE